MIFSIQRRAFAALFFLLIVSVMANAENKTVNMVYSSWCPHICTDENEVLLSQKPGFVIEMIQMSFAKKDIEVNFESQPFSRQLKDVKDGLYDAVIQIKKTPDRKYLYPEMHSGVDHQCFFVNATNNWRYIDMDSLKDIKIGAVEGYAYGRLTDYMRDENNKNLIFYLFGDNPTGRNLDKIKLGRIDTMIEERNVVAYYLKETGRSADFKEAGCLDKIPLYVAFSLALESSKGNAKILSDGIRELRQSGELQNLLDKYGVTDWASN